MNTDLAMATPHAHALINFILDFIITVCKTSQKRKWHIRM